MKSFVELTGKEKSIELIRWFLVPCVAVLVGFAVPRLIVNFLKPPTDFKPFYLPWHLPWWRFYLPWNLPWIATIVMGAAFVVTGAKTAPRGRLVTAFVLATLWTLCSLYFHVLIHPRRDILDQMYYMQFLVATLAAASGAAYIAYSERVRSKRPRPGPGPAS